MGSVLFHGEFPGLYFAVSQIEVIIDYACKSAAKVKYLGGLSEEHHLFQAIELRRQVIAMWRNTGSLPHHVAQNSCYMA